MIYKNTLSPYFSDIGVIALVPDVWGGSWTTRHHILTRLAMYFEVVWMNPAKGWRDLWVKRDMKKIAGKGERAFKSNFTIYNSGKLLPSVYKPRYLSTLIERHRLLQAQRTLSKKGCDKLIIYLWRPEFARSLDLIKHEISCYHIDDEYTFSEIDKPNADIEVATISRVDQVIIHSIELLKKKGNINHNTIHVPNGVDYFAYAKQREEPEDMKLIPRPRIGYVGVIKKQLDFSLLVELAQMHPGWSFVMVGPKGNLRGTERLVQELEKKPNVYFLGRKDLASLPAYTQSLDVCMMCYKVNDYTNYIYPIKLHEYLASGQPVVGSPIASLLEFDHIVTLARTTEEWSNAVQMLVDNRCSSSEQIEARRNVAREYDWNILVEKIARVICQHLGPNYLEYFEKMNQKNQHGASPEENNQAL